MAISIVDAVGAIGFSLLRFVLPPFCFSPNTALKVWPRRCLPSESFSSAAV
jgi:hypothetical protein